MSVQKIHDSIAGMDFFVIITVIGPDNGGLLNHKEEKSQWQRKEILLLVSLADLPL